MELQFLQNILKKNSIELPDEKVKALCLLSSLMIEFNSKVNITSITDDAGIAVKHIADSLTVIKYIKKNARVIDIGTGGGFPALPVAAVRDDVQITALDSTAKKLDFINTASEKLLLSNIKPLSARAEETAHDPAHRESYDTVLSRAVSKLNILCELCLPYLRLGGSFIAMKTSSVSTELDESLPVIKILGGTMAGNIPITLAGVDGEIKHTLLIIQKTSKTPAMYPRNYSQISKKPLI